MIPVTDALHLTIMGTDPGTTSVGLGLLRIRVPDWTIVGAAGKTLAAHRMPLDPLIVRHHGERIARLHVVRDLFAESFIQEQPYAIGCESPFYNPRTPGAYGPLVESIVYLRQAVMRYSRHCSLDMIEPTAIKKVMGFGHHDKDGVARALEALVGSLTTTPIRTWQSHATDGLAIAYCLYQQLRDYQTCQRSGLLLKG